MNHQNNILVVDDDSAGRNTLEALLLHEGYHLLFANNGEEALAMAQQFYPDLILLDIMMPDIDGFEVCRRLRRDENLAEVPIIVISALDDRPSRLRALEAGADDVMSKPFDRLELRTRIRAIIRLNRYRTLLYQRKRFEQLIEILPDSLALLDGSGMIKLTNPALCYLLAENDLLLKPFQGFIANQNQEQWQRFMEQLPKETIQSARTELYLMNSRGQCFPVELRAQISEWHDEKVIIALISDISERKENENKLRESETKLKRIIEASDDIIYMVNVEGEILFISPAILRLTGQDPEKFTGKLISSYIHTDDLESYLQSFKLLFIKQAETNKLEFRIRDRHLHWIWFSSNLSAVKDADGKVIYAVGVARDISKRIAFENALIQAKNEAEMANQAKDHFIAIVSHEIRNPLNGIIGMNELLLQTGLNQSQYELAQISIDSAQHLLRVVNEILDFSKIEAHKLVIQNQPFELFRLLNSLVQVMERQAQQKGLDFVFWLDERIPRFVSGDALHLQQILQNLTNNALKFTEQGLISLTVKMVEEAENSLYLQFKIQDTGIGITDEIKPKLFQAFVLGDDSSTRKYGGTGLGLVISKSLVEAMGGTIQFESKVGQGSIFKVFLSFNKARDLVDRNWQYFNRLAAGEQNIYQKSEIKQPSSAARILLVEDDQVSQRLGQLQLQELGYRVDCADNGQEALEKAGQGDYALIFMDSNMPIMDGFQASREIRKAEKETNRHIPIIALTARAMPEDQELCLQAGMDDFISKPASLKRISQVLDKWIAFTDRSDKAPIHTDNANTRKDSGNDLVHKELIPLFMQTMQDRLLEIQVAYQEEDWGIIGKIAHACISSSMAIGAQKLAQTARSIELAVREQDVGDIHLRLSRLQEEYQEILELCNQP